MNDLFDINPRISTLLCSIIGYVLIDDLTANEQNVLGNWLMLIAQILLTNATSQILIESKLSSNNININSSISKCKYNPTFYNIEEAKKILNVQSISQESINKLLKKIEIIENIFKSM